MTALEIYSGFVCGHLEKHVKYEAGQNAYSIGHQKS